MPGRIFRTPPTIPSEEWRAPTLLNGWSNFGGGADTAGYRKDPLGRVDLKGLVLAGNVGSAVLFLPAGYRPAANKFFVAANGSAMGRISVDASGAVIATHVPNPGSGLSLENVDFSVEAA